MIARFLDYVARTEALEAHATDTNNPHQVTKAQVGLGNVVNYPLATDAEATAGTSKTSYLTPYLATLLTNNILTNYVAKSQLAGGGWSTIVNRVLISNNSGVTELGKYLDFHNTGDESDYNLRYELRQGAKGWEIYNTGYYNCQDFYVRSDRRDKRGIEDLEGSLELLAGFFPKRYYLHEETELTAGLIAQDVLKVFPEAIVESTNEKGDPRLNLRPAAVNALLVGAVKELHEELKVLKAELKVLKGG